jgi:hypothetical protein
MTQKLAFYISTELILDYPKALLTIVFKATQGDAPPFYVLSGKA